MKLTTEAQKQASRENGRKSKGPISLKNLQRRLCIRSATLDIESQASFNSLLEGYRNHLQPQSVPEEGLVESLAMEAWRSRRSHAIGNAYLQNALPPEPDGEVAAPTSTRAFLENFDRQIDRIAAGYSSAWTKPEFRAIANRDDRHARTYDRIMASFIRMRRHFPVPAQQSAAEGEKAITPAPVEIDSSEPQNYEI